ncbi:TIGR03905 family TSCPD domain-containing protein [Caproiciproducens sp. NJN-50]|uniref:TIGR03905 family TSCPD domain-containing protein n=1 Tax=Acutalibacteraceae TaxID=3082771 RepID=UPI000FFE0B80|nr:MULTISPECIES: TIGR03905 family TSCPD domain-containing protein [Acutalibacteraceae]QAT49826.1 TIGR03905 family TSCPD domain-containing protein [Caproiciproducens sp. NJN-50]
MTYRYKTHGTCSSEMLIELDGDIIRSVRIMGGCSGNLQGICALIEGMKADEVIRRFSGIRCGSRPTSCPDQLAKALMQAREKAASK